MKLSQALKRARKKAGYTQETLSQALGVHIKTVMNWEQGIAEPALSTLKGLADLYGCDFDYLIGRIDCRTHDTQFICDQTGLSEEAVSVLSSNRTRSDILSKLIENKDFQHLLDRMNKNSEAVSELNEAWKKTFADKSKENEFITFPSFSLESAINGLSADYADKFKRILENNILEY